MLRRYFTPEEQQKLLATVGQYKDVLARRDHAWIRALLYSGERIEEFSLSSLGAALDALRSNYHFLPREHRKGKKKDHRVFVTAPLREAFEDLIKVHFEMMGGEHSHLDYPLVLSRQNAGGATGMTVRSFQKRMKEWAVMAGLPKDSSPHWLRHTRAINVMRKSQAEDPRGVVKAALGHDSISSTGVYTGTLKEDVEEALATADGKGSKRVSLAQMRKSFVGARA